MKEVFFIYAMIFIPIMTIVLGLVVLRYTKVKRKSIGMIWSFLIVLILLIARQ